MFWAKIILKNIFSLYFVCVNFRKRRSTTSFFNVGLICMREDSWSSTQDPLTTTMINDAVSFFISVISVFHKSFPQFNVLLLLLLLWHPSDSKERFCHFSFSDQPSSSYCFVFFQHQLAYQNVNVNVWLKSDQTLDRCHWIWIVNDIEFHYLLCCQMK